MWDIETKLFYEESMSRLHELAALAAAREKLDVKIAYPAMTALHRPLYEYAMRVRESTSGQERTIDRDEQVRRIASFFGLDGNVVLIHSAGAGLVSTLQYFTDVGQTVVLPEPAYLFESFVRCLADGMRHVSRVGTGGKQGLEALARELNGSAAIIETPRNQAFTNHSISVYRALTEGGDVVIYDGVNSFYDEDTTVRREADGNRLHRRLFPIADRAVRIDGTSKLFPGVFPNLALVEISDAVYTAKNGARYKEAITRQDFRTPSNTDLFVMAEILNSEMFPGFLEAIKSLTRENFLYVKSFLENTLGRIGTVEYDGPHAFIRFSHGDGESPDYTLRRYGIEALHSYQYCTHTQNEGVFIRLPIVMDRSDLEPIANELREKLRIMCEAARIIYDLEALKASS